MQLGSRRKEFFRYGQGSLGSSHNLVVDGGIGKQVTDTVSQLFAAGHESLPTLRPGGEFFNTPRLVLVAMDSSGVHGISIPIRLADLISRSECSRDLKIVPL